MKFNVKPVRPIVLFEILIGIFISFPASVSTFPTVIVVRFEDAGSFGIDSVFVSPHGHVYVLTPSASTVGSSVTTPPSHSWSAVLSIASVLVSPHGHVYVLTPS